MKYRADIFHGCQLFGTEHDFQAPFLLTFVTARAGEPLNDVSVGFVLMFGDRISP